MTMNEAQSQTLDYVRLYLPQPVFTHGQLYVGLSQAGGTNRIKVYAPQTDVLVQAVDGVLTRNVVYTKVLH